MRKPGFYNISITFVLRGELFWGISDVAIDGYTCPSRSEALVSDGPPTFTIWTGFLICSMLNMSSIIDLPQPTQTSTAHHWLKKQIKWRDTRMITQNSNAEVGDAGPLWVKLLGDIGEAYLGRNMTPITLLNGILSWICDFVHANILRDVNMFG